MKGEALDFVDWEEKNMKQYGIWKMFENFDHK